MQKAASTDKQQRLRIENQSWVIELNNLAFIYCVDPQAVGFRTCGKKEANGLSGAFWLKGI